MCIRDRSYSEYTSHYPKDQPGPKGRVICPTILSTECSYCHAIGHAKNHCPKLHKRKNCDNHVNNGRFAPKKRPQFQMNNRWNTVQKQKLKRSTAPKKAMAFQNKYAMLMEDDVVETTTFPLPKPSYKPQRLIGSWSNTLSKSVKEEAEPKPPSKLNTTLSFESDNSEETTEVAQLSAQEVLKILFDENQQKDQNKMWGDMSSDEEESDLSLIHI